MNLSYYCDHNVHRAIVTGLRRRGVDCLTAFEDSRARAPDDELLERATELSRILFTHDDDLLVIASEWLTSGHEFSGMVFGAQSQISIGGAIFDLELIARILSLPEMRNLVVHLPL